MAIARERVRDKERERRYINYKKNECLKMLVKTIDWGSEVECG